MGKKRKYNPVNRISEEDREKIRICILTNFKSYTSFCRKHSEFNCVYISNVISGRYLIESTKYRKLAGVLGNKYGL